MERLYWIKQLVEEVSGFIKKVYLPDVTAICAFYKDWFKYSAGVTNYLAVPDMPLDIKAEHFDLPGGTILDGDLKMVEAFTSFKDPYFKDNVVECVKHSWYKGDWTRSPFEEDTVPQYADFDPTGKYSWIKAPRFQGRPMQIGPLAKVLVGYAQGHELTKKYVDDALSKVSALARVQVGPEALHSTPGRHLARDVAIFNAPTFPKGEQRGFGFHEAPRGALSHWIVINDGKIKNYQCVVPSTWNAGPRDEKRKSWAL